MACMRRRQLVARAWAVHGFLVGLYTAAERPSPSLNPGRASPGTKAWSPGCQVTGPACALTATRHAGILRALLDERQHELKRRRDAPPMRARIAEVTAATEAAVRRTTARRASTR